MLGNVFANDGAPLDVSAGMRAAFQDAAPFPHAIIDDLFAPAALNALLAELPHPDVDGALYRSEKPGRSERKSALRDWRRMGPVTWQTISVLQSGVFTGFLEDLTGIAGLIADPTLNGGGIHMVQSGGLLGVHADFNIHPTLKLRRRLNVLVYLNHDWQADWGGALELWSRDMARCEVTVAPLFNRTVIFETASDSFHGHPDPLRCPDPVVRRSVALYYYTADGADAAAHSTLYQQRPA